jgi:hypothetical protein
LGLSDAKKAQIRQIRQNIPQGKERWKQILAVLTPEQKAQLKQGHPAVESRTSTALKHPKFYQRSFF